MNELDILSSDVKEIKQMLLSLTGKNPKGSKSKKERVSEYKRQLRLTTFNKKQK